MKVARSVAEALVRAHDPDPGVHRPDVPQRLRALASEGRGGGVILPQDAGRGRTVLGPDGPHDPALRRRHQEPSPPATASRSCRSRRGERKDDRTRQYLRRWSGGEGVLYIGKAQEKAKVVRTERRHDPATGDTYPWLAASTAMVNQFYFYAVDDDFGPFFLKFCSYFPYNAKLCINGHEYLKRQLTKRGIGYESLDNGILRCSDPERDAASGRRADGGGRSTRCCASGWPACPIPSRPPTVSRASATTSRFSRPSSL